MKTRALSVLALLVCLALVVPFAPVHSATQDPQLADLGPSGGPGPGGEPWGTGQPPEGLWAMPEGSSAPAGFTASAPRDTGGPDDFGYTWDNSVPFAWLDATSGTDTGMSGCNWGTHVGPIPLPFSFNFYGYDYDEIYIAASGYMAFSDDGYWPTQQNPMPSQNRPNNVISPFWTIVCLETSGPAGRVYYKAGGTAPNRYFVVEWFDVKGGLPTDPSGGDELYRFEAILYENGDILFQYHTMIYNDWRYYASIGIEDELGLDGLGYMDWNNYWSRLPGSSTAIRFLRPPPRARVKVWPLHHGSFTHPNEATAFQVPVLNTGDLGADTYDLFTSPLWPVSLYEADGVTPLTDTDGDGDVDTGPVDEGATVTFVAQVETPGSAVVGDDHTAAITVRSSLDTDKSKTASLRTAVPAPFAQVFRDDADGAMSLGLIQPAGQVIKQATPDWTNGSYPSIAETADGFAHFWTRSRYKGDVYVGEIEYALWDHVGRVTREVGRLTNHDGAVLTTNDYQPAVAVAPNGRIGVSWYRYLRDTISGDINYNIYFAVLDGAGNLVHGPTNVTNNTIWGHYSDYGLPQFYDARIAATGDNRFVLVWERYVNEAGGSVQDLYYAIRDTNGSGVVPITALTDDWPGYDQGFRYPALTRVGANRTLLAWLQESDDTIYYSVRDSAGDLVKAPTSLSVGWGWAIDAVELSNGHSLVAWSQAYGGDTQIFYAVLDAGYNHVAGPTALSHEAAVAGNAYVSVAADGAGHGILTWMDSDYDYRQQLYYALVGSSGELLTEPMIFYASQAASPNVETSYGGYGNTSYSWIPPADVDGDVAFGSPLVGAPPGENVMLGIEAANYGLTTAANLELVVTLDSELTYVGDNSGVTPAEIGNDVIWSLPDLAFFDSLDFRLIVQVPPGGAYGTRYPVTLTFNSDGPEGDPSNNTAAAEVMVAHQIYLPLVFKGH